MMTFKEAFAPAKPYKVVGLRAGEKVHETLISYEESYRAVDCGNDYIIHPSASHSSPFEYRSDTNTWRIDATDLRALAA
jgi:UDP-N-acetylglucosamine 4,6-dehydratase